ncbi:hypothetical protein GE09DRAFT_621047 [Coniochaeta sp. 2T2.1]|nr:hypothetical protein GE09DRAFT_621047 [Coniochaeta sp. 2T2.1]
MLQISVPDLQDTGLDVGGTVTEPLESTCFSTLSGQRKASHISPPTCRCLRKISFLTPTTPPHVVLCYGSTKKQEHHEIPLAGTEQLSFSGNSVSSLTPRQVDVRAAVRNDQGRQGSCVILNDNAVVPASWFPASRQFWMAISPSPITVPYRLGVLKHGPGRPSPVDGLASGTADCAWRREAAVGALHCPCSRIRNDNRCPGRNDFLLRLDEAR